ncbi:MAG: hypothetical protein QXH12_05685 [Candidatus Caldarchaeum sp.]
MASNTYQPKIQTIVDVRGKTRLMVIVAVAAFLLATAVALRVQQLGQVATVTVTVTRFGAPAQSPDVVKNVCFSRVSACDVLLYEVLRSAERKVLVAVYSFTSDLLADGLIHAVKRGVEVRVSTGRGSRLGIYTLEGCRCRCKVGRQPSPNAL